MNSTTALAVALGGTMLLLAIGAVVWWLNRTPRAYRQASDPDLPLFSVSLAETRRRTPPSASVVAAASVAAPPAPRPSHTTTEDAVAARGRSSSTRGARDSALDNALERTVDSALDGATDGETVSVRAEPVVATKPNRTAESAKTPTAITEHGVPGTLVEGHTLRFSVPAEGTLQFLPGRLEIRSGLDEGREIRFVRVPGPNGTEVSFGRSEGPAYRHVQLRESTVSRSHAKLRLVAGDWHLINLSETNPVVLNDRELTVDEEHLLTDGDRIEMGEVVFGFRSR